MSKKKPQQRVRNGLVPVLLKKDRKEEYSKYQNVNLDTR